MARLMLEKQLVQHEGPWILGSDFSLADVSWVVIFERLLEADYIHVFLDDQVIVLSGRPATAQHVMDIDLGEERSLDDLYTPESAERLNILRHQIEIAQGRNKTD